MSRGFLFRTIVAIFFGTYLAQSPAQASLLFSVAGSGSLVINPAPNGLLAETITVSFPTALPFPLDTGVLQTNIDPTLLPDISQALSDSRFSMTSTDGDAVFGTYDLTSSIFHDATHETFGGLFTFTGGVGLYAGARGGGMFSGTNVYDSSLDLSGRTSLSATGLLTSIPEPPAATLLGFGLVVIVLWHTRIRRVDWRRPGN